MKIHIWGGCADLRKDTSYTICGKKVNQSGIASMGVFTEVDCKICLRIGLRQASEQLEAIKNRIEEIK